MCVVSGSVRLQVLTVSPLSSESCAVLIFAFWQSKNIFGRIFICRICVRSADYNVKKEDGRFILRVVFPNFCYLLHCIFNPSVLFGPSAFSSPQKLYDKQTYNSKLLSHHRSYSIQQSHKNYTNIRIKLSYL